MRYVLNGLPTSHILAQAYGTSIYGAGNYNQGQIATGTSASGSGSGSGTLANTGFIVLLAVTAAVIIIFMALVVRLMHKTKKNSSKDNKLPVSPTHTTPPAA